MKVLEVSLSDEAAYLAQSKAEEAGISMSTWIERAVIRRIIVDNNPDFESLEAYLQRARKEYVQAALDRSGGNRTHAAKLLSVEPRTVFRIIGLKAKD
jgi:transcriptional regulator with PAS, ATPase and Fis domain